MDICPKCNATLNNDEKASGKCFSCGASFETEWSKERDTQATTNFGENTIAKSIKICAITIFVVGTIGSFILASNSDTFVSFIASEACTIVSGLLFLGLSEIIQILEDIKNKMK